MHLFAGFTREKKEQNSIIACTGVDGPPAPLSCAAVQGMPIFFLLFPISWPLAHLPRTHFEKNGTAQPRLVG